MARSDLLISLVKSGMEGNKALFKRTVEALVADERAKQHHVLAERLEKVSTINGNSQINGNETFDSHIGNLLYEITPERTLESLILPDTVRETCLEIVEEHNRSDLLRSYSLEPRNRILLSGPPGNGKTSLAEAIAESLILPFYIVRYEGVIGTYLGQTAVRLKKIFDFVRHRQCVVFFDEFDTLGKERGDVHETGEIKRVVSSLLMQIDALPSHVVAITATNHPELLDRAVWRRFQAKLLLPPPNQKQIEEWLIMYQEKAKEPLGFSQNTIAKELNGLSFSEIEDFGTDILRKYVLSLPDTNMKKIVGSCLKQLKNRNPIK